MIHSFTQGIARALHISAYAITGAKRNRDAASTVSITEAMVMAQEAAVTGLNWLQFCLAVDSYTPPCNSVFLPHL